MENKIKVCVLGATGAVGQKFVQLLSKHPWFEISALAASDRSVGKLYGECVRNTYPGNLSSEVFNMKISACRPGLSGKIAFSGLDSSIAGEIEKEFAQAGYIVISNSRNYRMEKDVPLLIPEVNPCHLALLDQQNFGTGKIVTNPNCSVIGITMALKPLIDQWGVKDVHVTTLQALSGAGYPGIPSLDMLDNVIPFIDGEEEKIESEPLKILGNLAQGQVTFSKIRFSAHCNRVAVADGHLACISLKMHQSVEREEIIKAWNEFRGDPQVLHLPSAPISPLIYMENERHPQPRLHRDLDQGMAVAIGRLRKCPLMDWKFVILSHNTIRGAAGCAILNAELMLKKGKL